MGICIRARPTLNQSLETGAQRKRHLSSEINAPKGLLWCARARAQYQRAPVHGAESGAGFARARCRYRWRRQKQLAANNIRTSVGVAFARLQIAIGVSISISVSVSFTRLQQQTNDIVQVVRAYAARRQRPQTWARSHLLRIRFLCLWLRRLLCVYSEVCFGFGFGFDSVSNSNPDLNLGPDLELHLARHSKPPRADSTRLVCYPNELSHSFSCQIFST